MAPAPQGRGRAVVMDGALLGSEDALDDTAHAQGATPNRRRLTWRFPLTHA